MKTIAILGGLGPQATMDFEARIHRVSQALIPPRFGSGYPPMYVYYHRRPPMLLDDHSRPVQPIQPDPDLLAAAKHLGAVSDFLVITANGPHVFQEQFEAAAGRPLLSMIDVTLDEVVRRGWQSVGVLGLGQPQVYLEPLAEMNLDAETIPAEFQAILDEAVFALMAGQETEKSTAAAWSAIQYLRAKNVDGIIPGCTEIPLLLGGVEAEPDLLNPAQLLAEAAVRQVIS
ncbi:MAG: aspartate/glutamate racemase family protein [Chloroflexota bacterium]|nr:MAG: aspartate/glutamate racemase family protein [Chloroflexota bacterium]